MASNEGGFLRDVILNPSKSVTYRPIPNKQMAEVSIQNNEKTAIIYKWKSTRPGMYKMRPVYGVLGPGEKGDVHLFCKGVKDVQNAPTADRYTCVMAATPSANVNPESVWSNHKYQQKLASTGKLRKVKLLIVYQGVNDKEPKPAPADEEGAGEENDEKDRVGKMRQKEKKTDTIKEEKEKEKDKEKETEKKKKDNRKKATLVMFTRKEGESASGEDDGPDDTPAIPAPPQQKNWMDLLKPVNEAGLFHNKQQANIPQPIPGHPGAIAALAKAKSLSKVNAPAGAAAGGAAAAVPPAGATPPAPGAAGLLPVPPPIAPPAGEAPPKDGEQKSKKVEPVSKSCF